VQTPQLRYARQQKEVPEEAGKTQALQMVQQAYLAQGDEVV
jgi:hypothetical protein